MSKYIRSVKRPVVAFACEAAQDETAPEYTALRSSVRKPLSQAAAGLASMMLVTGAAAQDSNTTAPATAAAPPKPPSDSTAQQGATTLPRIEVRAPKRKPRARPAPAPSAAPAAATEPAASLQAPTNTSLNRIPTSLLNTPQSVAVVPQVLIQQQVVSDVKDALRNVAGITFRAGEGGNQGDTPYIRGFSAQNDVFRDGIRDPGWYTRDAFAVDAVEVYKGPSSVLFGRGSTGGAINLVSKLPQDRSFVEGTISANTGPGVRATVDANGKVNENVTTRLVVMGQRYDIPDRDHVETNRWGIAPSIKVKIDNQTTNTLSYIYQHDTNVPDYGLPFLPTTFGNPRIVVPVSRNTWYGILSGPTPDTETVDAHVLTNKFEHEVNKDFKIINTTRYVSVDHFQRNVFPEPVPTSLSATWTPNRAQIATTNTLAANNTDVLAKFNTGSLEHTTVSGVELNRETRDLLRNTFAGQAGTDLFNPDPYRFGGTPQAPTANQLTSGEATDVAFYAADQVKINRYFEVLGSIRVEQYNFKQNAPLAAASIQNLGRDDTLVSWRVGGVFHPTLNSSIYVMHGTSFNPSADNLSISVSNATTAASLAQIAPEKNETTEVGVKVDVLDKKLSLASAVFHTEKTNLRVPDPANSAVTILAGVVTADGFEASATGYITKLWQVIASYTYVHARITSTTNPAQLNTEPLNTPTHSFSLWSTYDVTPKFQVGGGAFYGGEVYGDTANTALVPSWWRFDAMAAYKISPKATLQFNIYNLTDKLYYASAYSNWAVPASGRTAALSLRVRY